MTKQLKPKELTELAREGARKMLSMCVPLRAGDTAAIFYDGTTRGVATLLREASQELDLNLRERYVPVKQQIASQGSPFPDDLSAMGDALAVLTCISSNPRSTAYRRGLIKAGTNFDNYFGHVPGANVKILAYAMNIDFEEAESRCDDLALALARSKKAVVRTYDLDASGNPQSEHILHLSFAEGRLPITSTGKIPRGTWGNIPGGEAFVAPAEGRANGTFALNGAFHNYVLPAGASLHLIFEDGALVRIEGSGEPLAAFNRLFNSMKGNGGPQYNQLAELGIGVNSGISELTGTELLDEKCVGTAHIAIGDNTRFGGNNESGVHEDFITRKPSIELDEIPILEAGANAFDALRWRESVFDGGVAKEDWHSDPYLQRGLRGEAIDGTALLINQEVAAGRICRYTIGNKESSPILSALYRMLPDHFSNICDTANKGLNLSRETTIRGLEILQTHGLVRKQHRAD
jgi:hypothetical protein